MNRLVFAPVGLALMLALTAGLLQQKAQGESRLARGGCCQRERWQRKQRTRRCEALVL